jgi:hypothetical protein
LNLEQLLSTLPDDEPDKAAVVLRTLRGTDVFLLGNPGHNPPDEVDILMFTTDDDQAMVPVFTSPDYMSAAVKRNPDWANMEVYKLPASKVLDSLDPGQMLLINPWTPLQYAVVSPPGSIEGLLRSRAAGV